MVYIKTPLGLPLTLHVVLDCRWCLVISWYSKVIPQDIQLHIYIFLSLRYFFFHLQTSSLTVFNYRLSLEKKSPRDTGIFCPFWILFFLPRLRTKRPSNIDYCLCLRFKKKQHCCQQPIL